MSIDTSIDYAYRESQLFFVAPPTTAAFLCVGYAPSRGRRCKNLINRDNRHEVLRLTLQIRLMQQAGLDVDNDLLNLASLALCKKNHQKQAPFLAREWGARIAQGQATRREPLHDITAGARNTTRSAIASIDHRGPARRQAQVTIFRDESEPTTAEVVLHQPAVQRRAVLQQNSTPPATTEIQHGLLTPPTTPEASRIISGSILPAPPYYPSPLRPRAQEAPATSGLVARANTHLPREHARPAPAPTAFTDPFTATVLPPLPAHLPVQAGEQAEEEEEEGEEEEHGQPISLQPQAADPPTPWENPHPPHPPTIQHHSPAPDNPFGPLAMQPPVEEPAPTPHPPLPRPTIPTPPTTRDIPPPTAQTALPTPAPPAPGPSHTPPPPALAQHGSPARREDQDTHVELALPTTGQRVGDVMAGTRESWGAVECLGADMCLGGCLSWAERWMYGLWF